MAAEHTVTVDQSDPGRGRYDPSRAGRPNQADTEPRPPIPARDIEATRAELAELRRRRACPPRPPKEDVTEMLIAAMEEVVKIAAGEIPPGRVHTVEDIIARAGPQGVEEAARQARRRLRVGK